MLSNPTNISEDITERLITIIQDMTSDWDLGSSASMNRDTCLIGDLAFESIDIVQLVVAIEQAFNKRDLPFVKVLMAEGRYIDDITIGALSDFLAQYL